MKRAIINLKKKTFYPVLFRFQPLEILVNNVDVGFFVVVNFPLKWLEFQLNKHDYIVIVAALYRAPEKCKN